MPDSDVVYETSRTLVRLWRPDEADRLFDLLSRWEVMQWLGTNPKVLEQRSEAEMRIARWAEEFDEEPRFGAWAVEVKESGITAGTMLLKPLPEGEGEVEIGWHFHPDSWGRGLATESALVALGKGFAEGLHEIFAVTHLGNEPSMNVCRRIGMRHLGITTKWYGEQSELFRIGSNEWVVPVQSSD